MSTNISLFTVSDHSFNYCVLCSDLNIDRKDRIIHLTYY